MKHREQASLYVGIVLLIALPQLLFGQWVQSTGLTGGPVQAIVSIGSHFFAGLQGAGAYVSTDSGATWSVANSGLGDLRIQCMAVEGTSVLVGTNGGGVYRSSDNAGSWTSASAGEAGGDVKGMIACKTVLYHGSWGSGLSRSTNDGTQWSTVNTGIPTDDRPRSLGTNGTDIFVGMWDNGVYKAADTGTTWTAMNTGLTNAGSSYALCIRCFAFNSTYAFAGSEGDGVFRSADNGATWNAARVGLTNLNVMALAVNGSKIYAGTGSDYTTGGNGVFLSSDSGAHWSAVNAGLPANTGINSLLSSGTYLLAGTQQSGVWRMSLLPTSASTPCAAAVQRLSLSVTPADRVGHAASVTFTLPTAARVALTVSDLSGHTRALLAQNDFSAGTHHILWSAQRSTSGCYVVTLRVGNVVRTQSIQLF